MPLPSDASFSRMSIGLDRMSCVSKGSDAGHSCQASDRRRVPAGTASWEMQDVSNIDFTLLSCFTNNDSKLP